MSVRSAKPEAIYPTISVPPRVVTSASLSRCGCFAIASDGTAQAMEQDMPNDDPFDVRAIDRKALSPDEWYALKRRLIRRAHAERADAISAMFAGLFCRRRRALHADTGAAIAEDGRSQSGDLRSEDLRDERVPFSHA